MKEIGASSETYYNSRFYNSDQAVYYQKLLLESGTEGALGKFETYIPQMNICFYVSFQNALSIISLRIPITTQFGLNLHLKQFSKS